MDQEVLGVQEVLWVPFLRHDLQGQALHLFQGYPRVLVLRGFQRLLLVLEDLVLPFHLFLQLLLVILSLPNVC